MGSGSTVMPPGSQGGELQYSNINKSDDITHHPCMYDKIITSLEMF
jgi:hypothetical protein